MAIKSEYARELANLKSYEFYGFASYIPGRSGYSGDFKRHKTLGHAKGAITNMKLTYGHYDTSKCKLYRWHEDKWLEVFI